jgi:molybdate transport system permease protein
MDWEAAGLSFRLAFATSFFLVLIGIPLAYWLATSRWRGKVLVESFVTLPLVLPPTVLGFYILFVMSPNTSFGRFYQNLTGGSLPFSFTGLLVGSIIYSLPFAVQPFLAAFSSIDRSLLESSWSLGVSPLRTFFKLILPLSISGIVTGFTMSFAHTLGEFGLVLMIGGNIPGVTKTLSISIYDSIQVFDYASAGETAFFLLGISFLVLAITTLLKKRSALAWQLN